MQSHAITCHKMSLEIANKETSDEFTTFGDIFMRKFQKGIWLRALHKKQKMRLRTMIWQLGIWQQQNLVE